MLPPVVVSCAQRGVDKIPPEWILRRPKEFYFSIPPALFRVP